MNMGQSTKKSEISFAERRSWIVAWTAGAGRTRDAVKRQFRKLALGIKKHAWAVFAVLLAAAVMEFNYYQARLTREYLRAFLVNTAEMSGEMDTLDARLNQLSMKIDSLNAKLDKPPAASSAAPQTKPKHSIFSKPW
jgi:hypothetical protein